MLNDSSNEESKFATKKWYFIDKGKYKEGDTIKFATIKSSLCDYSDAFILVPGNITVAANNDTDCAFKNCAPFSTCTTKINDIFVDEANHIYIAIPMYNLIEYSDNYSDISVKIWQFKRDEVTDKNADLSIDNFQSFKYKAALLAKTANHNDGKSFVKEAKLVVPLNYFNNFWRSIEMPLINCKVYLELNWIEDCILSSDGYSAKFAIKDAKLHVSIITLSTKDSEKLAKQLNEGSKRSVYWNSYETKPANVIEQEKKISELLNASFQGVKRLFVLAYFIAAPVGDNPADNTAGIKSNKKYFLRRGEIKNYNVLIVGINFYDQSINDIIKQHDEFRKVSTRYGDDYTTGCLLDYAYFNDNYRLIAVDLCKKNI